MASETLPPENVWKVCCVWRYPGQVFVRVINEIVIGVWQLGSPGNHQSIRGLSVGMVHPPSIDKSDDKSRLEMGG